MLSVVSMAKATRPQHSNLQLLLKESEKQSSTHQNELQAQRRRVRDLNSALVRSDVTFSGKCTVIVMFSFTLYGFNNSVYSGTMANVCISRG